MDWMTRKKLEELRETCKKADSVEALRAAMLELVECTLKVGQSVSHASYDLAMRDSGR